MKKSKIFFMLVAIYVVVFAAVCVNAAEDITVDTNTMNIVVDGERVFADNFVYADTTYVPLRRVAEMLGKKVDWDPALNGALISDTTEAVVTDGEKAGLESQKAKVINVDKNTMNIYVNGVLVEADNFVYKETTYVPLRKIAEMLQKEVNWEKLSNTASVGKKGIGFFDGKVLGTINGIEFTDYMYEYYGAMYESEYEYYTMQDIDPQTAMITNKDEYIMDLLKVDYTLIDYALKNGMCMTPLYNSSYYDSVASTLKGVKGDQEKFNQMLEMQGFTSLNSYYYAMLVADLYVQYSQKYVADVTEMDIEDFYNENVDLQQQYSFAEAYEDIVRIISRQRASEDLENMAKNAVVARK